MSYNTTAWTTDGQTQTTGGATLYAHFGIGSGDAVWLGASMIHIMQFHLIV